MTGIGSVTPLFNWSDAYTGVDLDALGLASDRPVLEVGAGNGGVTETLLDRSPTANLWCVEPGADARAVLRARIQGHGAAEHVTVLPGTIGEVLDAGWLPDGIGGVLVVGVAYFLSPEEHERMWAGLLPLLADDAAVVIGPLVPDSPEQHEHRPFHRKREARLGATTLEWWAEGASGGAQRHVFRTLLDGEVIEEVEDHHPAPRSTTDEVVARIPTCLERVAEQEGDGIRTYRYRRPA